MTAGRRRKVGRMLAGLLPALVLPALLLGPPARAETMARITCAAVRGVGYVGGCPSMEGRSVTMDAALSWFGGDPEKACARVTGNARQALTNQLQAADRARPGSLVGLCQRLTIRCGACEPVER